MNCSMTLVLQYSDNNLRSFKLKTEPVPIPGEMTFSIFLSINKIKYSYMILLSQRDFETKTGQTKIIQTIHQLEAKIHELEITVHELAQKDEMFEKDLQS